MAMAGWSRAVKGVLWYLPSMLPFLPFKHIVKLCCIDVGTNSVLSLLSKIDSRGRITPLQFHAETTRLGKNLREKGTLDKASLRRTISAVRKYIRGADKYLIVGTSALREARDSKKIGLPIKIISEGEEARLVFESVKHYIRYLPKRTLICDIGGGSTEFITCVNGRAIRKISIPIGAVNLTEKTIPLTLPSPLGERALIGVGGTVTTLGAILKRLKRYNPDKVHGYVVPFYKVANTLERLRSMPLSERKRLISFDPKRADIIVAGLCILKAIMESFGIDKVKICDRGLVYGLAINYAKYTRGTFSLHRTS